MDHALDEKEQQQLISGNYAGLNCVYIYAEVLNYLESVFKEHLPTPSRRALMAVMIKPVRVCDPH